MVPSRYTQPLLLLVLGLSVVCRAESGQEATFETEATRFVLNTRGMTQNLLEKKTGRNWLTAQPHAFASVKKDGKYSPASGLARDGELWQAQFGAAQVQATFRITARPRYVVLELIRVQGEGVQEVRFGELQVTCRENAGWWLGAWWNEQFAVALFGLSDRVNVQLLGNGALAASVYPEFGMEGQRVVLAAVPTAQFLDVVQEVERDFGLPSPKIGGEWAKTSRAVRRGYLFTDLTEANADETIRFAKLGGFGYIMTYDSTWSKSLGSYPINTNNFPRGAASLKATVDKCHAAGLKVGLHVLTSFVGKNDPLVRPRPDPRLLKDDQATLATDIDEKTADIVATGSLASFPTEGAFYGDAKAGFDIQIDEELIQYRAVGGPGTNTLLQCTRGFAGTRAAPHKAGAKIHHLVERYGSYLADLRTTLKGEISDRIAGVINRCGFDMIYFDGGECNMANGPFWYWVSRQQDDVCRRVTRDLLVQGSGSTAWTWHWFARGNCDDFASVAPKQYLDYHKIADSWTHHRQSFMPAELGWWGFLAYEPSHPATLPDEVEYYAVRMLALDTPVSLETNLAALQRNGRTDEMLKLLGRYERLRLGGIVPESVREKLRTGEWHLGQEDGKPAFSPIRYEVQRASVPGELRVTNTFGLQPLKLRLQAVPTLAAAGDKMNVVLLRAEPALELSLPKNGAPMPGALAHRTDFAKPLDLLHHRALAVRLRVDGSSPTPDQSCAVLNVQLEAGGKTYRDHYMDLDFRGEKTIVLPEPTTARMLPEFRPAHTNYAFKAAMYGFEYRHIVALNLRWMRLAENQPVTCRVALVEALAETEVPLRDAEVIVDGKSLKIPGDLKAGDYAEFQADGPARVFDRNGVLLSSCGPENDGPILQAGANRIVLRAAGAGCVKLTAITVGDALSW
ncbi:MAG: hypothetical protein M1376_09650 [Planctomycetes bacterium]|nr:hypothetical protein [Planctomycetota bacterium]